MLWAGKVPNRAAEAFALRAQLYPIIRNKGAAQEEVCKRLAFGQETLRSKANRKSKLRALGRRPAPKVAIAIVAPLRGYNLFLAEGQPAAGRGLLSLFLLCSCSATQEQSKSREAVAEGGYPEDIPACTKAGLYKSYAFVQAGFCTGR